MLDKEVFIDSLKGKLRDDIQMLIYECQHRGEKKYLDVASLNAKLLSLKSFSMNDGLSEDDWLEIVFEICPEIYDQLDFGPIAA
jgi:hypothetical protein